LFFFVDRSIPNNKSKKLVAKEEAALIDIGFMV